MTQRSPFRYFKTSPEIIRLAVLMYVRFSVSLRNVKDLLQERGIEISHETARFWRNRFGPLFTAEIRKNRVRKLNALSHWHWRLDEVFVKIIGATHLLWRAVDYEGTVLSKPTPAKSWITQGGSIRDEINVISKNLAALISLECRPVEGPLVPNGA